MKKIFKTSLGLLAMAGLLILTSCGVFSLFPIYTDKTTVYFPELIGKWQQANETTTFIEFEQYDSAKNYYRLTVTDEKEGKEILFEGRIAQIGRDYFMDFYPICQDCFVNDTYEWYYLPMHTFSKIQIGKKEMTLTDFDMEKLIDLFERNRIRLRHEKVDGSILITAQANEIQKFLESYSEEESVFENPDTYHRISD